MDFAFGLKCVDGKELELLIKMLNEIIESAKHERDMKNTGECSMWNVEQLDNIVIPEMNELLKHAMVGKVFFKYGEQQRLLESSYLLTDSFEELDVTTLGMKIRELQKLYNSL